MHPFPSGLVWFFRGLQACPHCIWFYTCHLPLVSSNFRNQPPQKRETTHLPQSENEGKIPGNSKCSLVANAEMETEINFLLSRSKRRSVFPPSSLGPTSRLKRTGNQSLYSFGGSHTPVPFVVTLPHPTEAEVIVPHPSPLALCPFSTSVGRGRHIWPRRRCTAQRGSAGPGPIGCRVGGTLALCSTSMVTGPAARFVLRLMPPRP